MQRTALSLERERGCRLDGLCQRHGDVYVCSVPIEAASGSLLVTRLRGNVADPFLTSASFHGHVPTVSVSASASRLASVSVSHVVPLVGQPVRVCRPTARQCPSTISSSHGLQENFCCSRLGSVYALCRCSRGCAPSSDLAVSRAAGKVSAWSGGTRYSTPPW